MSPLDAAAVIVPGEPAKSELVRRITAAKSSDRMPPPDQRRQLTEDQIDLLKRWVEEGAVWDAHWTYLPPKRSPLPEMADGARAGNRIDHFILARLVTEDLEPSPAAEKRTLLRRLSFDVTGLPPSRREIDDFLDDAASDAYDTVVDRLLASPRYGERMATHWLDLVRYADTSGYHSDEEVSVWPYRDYVISAFNENMPFDRFTQENLAGDLLPDATLQQKVASAFNRLNQTTAEGGAQAKEYLTIYAADRVRAVSTVWMGATMACAQCHDHKFDPYTMEDFYSLAAFFADVEEPGVYKGRSRWEPVVALPTEAQAAELEEIDRESERVKAAYEAESPTLRDARMVWESETLRQIDSSEPADLVWIDDEENHDGQSLGTWRFVDSAEAPVLSGRHARYQTTTDQAIIQHGFHDAKSPLTLQEEDRFFATVWIDPLHPPYAVMLQWNDGNWEHRAYWGQDRIRFGGIGQNGPAHRSMGALPKSGQWVRLEVDPALVGLGAGSVLNGIAFTQFGGTAYWDKAGLATSAAAKMEHGLSPELWAALEAPRKSRTIDQERDIDAYFRQVTPALAQTRRALKRLETRKKDLEKELPYCLTTVAQAPRPMRVLPRGNWLDDSGPLVSPNTPQFLIGVEGPEGGRATRLDLANWLVSPHNPLTARAFVNRLWAMIFGTGLSKVLDDLGSQGEWPTHPELLDWLAVEFMESGWDVKHMVRLMVTSNTYRQSSRPTRALRERDPYNRLLARQSRRRLDAEMIRDNALQVSGLLVNRMGGKSVRPYQPAGYYANLNFPKRTYQHDRGADQYRRGLYTHWQRTFLHPSLMAFDAPSRQECTAQRANANTPLQALTLLNDPSYVEAARVFAMRIIREGGRSRAERLTWAFREALSRSPDPEEARLLLELHNKHASEFQKQEDAAHTLSAVGEWSFPSDLEAVEVAAWVSVARVLLNLHEGITRY